MRAITREEFIEAYNRHQPAKWIRFAFKYFSKDTVEKNLKASKIIQGLLLSLFGLGFAATVAKFPRSVRLIITVAFFIILAPLVIFLMAAGLSNNLRIRGICRVLGIQLWEYNELVDFYLKPER